MEFNYHYLDIDDLQGSLVADYLVAADADFYVTESDRVVFQEPYFPVVELARSLVEWSTSPSQGNFVFETLSSDILGVVTIALEPDGWVVFSEFHPESKSPPVSRPEIDSCVARFVAAIRDDLSARGVDSDRILDPKNWS